MPAVVRDDWFQSYTRGAPPQSSPGNLIQPSGHLGFIQFGLRLRPKRARVFSNNGPTPIGWRRL
jgi:hypothetical protein